MDIFAPEARRLGHGGRYVIPSLVVVLLAGLVLFALYSVGSVQLTGRSGDLVSGPLFGILLIVPGALCIMRGILLPSERAGWIALGVGMLLWGAGHIYWNVAVQGLDPEPYPTAADLLYAAFYPFMLLGVGLLVRARVGLSHTSVWLDGVIGVLCIAAVGSALILPTLLEGATDGEVDAVVSHLAYPLGDLVLLAFAIGALAASGWRPGRGWSLVIGGLTSLAVADVTYLWQLANDDYVQGTLLDVTWPAALVMLGCASWQHGEKATSLVDHAGWRLLAVPAGFGVTAIALLSYGNIADLGLTALILSAATLVAVVARMALAFRENLVLAEGLQSANELAATDPLTGLPNHRTLHERLGAEVERARRHERDLSLVVFDLDNFKHINDVHGHQVGDGVLQETARRLGRHVRPGDLLGRIGGEEFAWVLPDADGLDAWDAAERVRIAVAAEPFAAVGNITVSAGVCDITHGETAAELFRLADGALYWAKLDGRNVAHRYTPEVVAALSAEERAELLERSQALSAIRVLARAVDAKDPTTQRHSERVADLAGSIAERLGWPQDRVALLREAGLVHDVGKIGVPDAILRKAGSLTPEEYKQIQAHAALSAQIVSEVLSTEQIAWVRGHHERWDGRGYPDGLAGEKLPAGARILAVADSWDAMTASRPYREALSVREALAECRMGAGTQWSAEVVTALLELLEVDLVPISEVRQHVLTG